MASLGTLAATLRLDGASSFAGGLNAAGRAASGLGGAVSSLQGPLALLGVSFGAFKSIQGITEALKGVFATGRELQTLSRTTGESVRDLVILQKAFGAAGLSAEEVPGSLRLMQRALGGVNEEGQPTATVFARLGLSIRNLKTETAVQQFQQIGASIRKLPDQASQAAAAMQIFGRSGAEMLAIFADPAVIENVAKSAGGAADVFQRQAATFARITTDLNALGGKTRALFVGIADGIAPVLLPLLDRLKAVDLLPIGEQVGHAVQAVAAAFERGRLGELFGASLQLGIAKAINFLAGAMGPVGHALAALFGGQIDALAKSFEPLIDGVSGLMEAGLLKAFTGPVKYLQAAMEGIMETHRLQADVAAGKIQDTGHLMDKTPVELSKHLMQLQRLVAQPGHTDAQQEFYQRQLDQAKLFQSDPSRFVRPWRSVQEIMDEHANEQPRFGLGGMGQTAGEMTGEARGNLQKASAALTKSTTDIAATLAKAFRDIRPGNVVDEKALGGELASLMRQLQGAGDAIPATVAKSGRSLNFAASGKAAEGDRLARIGGFIGGGGGPALEFHRRTAAATEKTAAGIQALLTRLPAINLDSKTAVWAA